MSKILTQRDFDKIKALTKVGKDKYEIADQLGFSPTTVLHARKVSSYYGYRMRYVEKTHKKKFGVRYLPAPVTELPIEQKNDWKGIAVTFIAILMTILVGLIAVETIIIINLLGATAS